MSSLPPPPAHVAPFVEVLGTEEAVNFLLTFGGAELYLSEKPRPDSRLSRAIGQRRATELARSGLRVPRRIPTAKPWIARVMHAQGLSVAEIARRLHVSDVAVRGWLKDTGGESTGDDPQLSLF